MRVGPNFFVIGAQRSGTTRFAHLLASHPDVAIPQKEMHYFRAADEMVRKDGWYHDLFAATAGVPLRGDASTGYSMAAMFPGVPERIYAYNPAARIIYLVRHPIRRIESAWGLVRAHGLAPRSPGFSRLVADRPDWMVDPSLYWSQLSAYLTLFPAEHVKVVLFEDFTRDEAATVADCWSFLGADPMPVTAEETAMHRTADQREMLAPVDRFRLTLGERRWTRIPGRLRAFVTPPNGRFTRPLRPTPVAWDPALLARVTEQVRPEAEKILRHAGRSPEFWPLPS